MEFRERLQGASPAGPALSEPPPPLLPYRARTPGEVGEGCDEIPWKDSFALVESPGLDAGAE